MPNQTLGNVNIGYGLAGSPGQKAEKVMITKPH